jgi:hypothetical protein
MPYATGAMPYADGGVVDDALRLANQGKYRLHQTIARHGYATDGEVKPEEPQVEAHGEVEFAPEYMPRPTEQVQQPNEASSQAFIHEGLKGSAPQYDPTVERGIGHGLTAAAKWTPPGAVADAAGLLGGPSLYQNVKEGRYMPAALQVASVGLPAALAGRAAIAAGLGTGASKFTKLGKPDVYGMPGYIGYQTAEDWGPSVLGKETYEGAKKAGKAALEKGTNYIKSKFGYADGGMVQDALRLARSRQGYATKGEVEGDVQFAPEYMPRPTEQVQQPNEASSQEFIHEGLKGSAPQYDPEGGMKTAKEAGQLVAGMTTPGAIADAAGYLGGPSALQNVLDKNYGTAALQLASAIPGVGPLAKAGGAAHLAMSMVPKARVVEDALRVAKSDAIPKVAQEINEPKFLYRGTTGSDERITGGIGEGYLFATPHEDVAKLYGDNLERIGIHPDAKILIEGSPEFASVTGRRRGPLLRTLRSGENLLSASNDALKAAKDAGYDALEFNSMKDMGTAIINEDKFIRNMALESKKIPKKNKTQLATGGGAWTRKEGQSPSGGLNQKGRDSLKAQGHDIKPPQPEGGPRRDSYCARSAGQAKMFPEAAKDPNSRLNKARRKWNCADGGAVDDAMRLAKGGEVWEKPRPKSLGKPKHLSESQKASAKASAKAAGRPYPSFVDNINAAKRGK